MIEIQGIAKKYKRRINKKKKKFEEITAVDHIDLLIKKGEIFGLIGPNGAGKTTILKILSTLIIPDDGTAKINKYDIINDSEMIKKNIGLLSGEFVRSFYWRLSARQNLKFFAQIRNVRNPEERVDELIKIFNLKDQENELVMKFSTGMKHKLALAVGIIHDPPVLFLDEPLSNIDPVTAYEIKDLIKNKFKDKTIIWASHNLYEIEEMCDRIALIKNGKIILEGTPDKLKHNYWNQTKIIIVTDTPNAFSPLGNVVITKNVVKIETTNINTALCEIMKLIKDNNIKIIEFKTVRPTLEDIFMQQVRNVR